MRIGKQQKPAPEPEAPSGVRIRHADGRVTECAVVRAPEDSPDGLTHWIAEPPPGTVFALGADTVAAEFMPARSVLAFRLDMGPEALDY